jgi:tetratricopeptide (TPR) repeat protein
LRFFTGSFALFLVASLFVYWPALRGDYIWDDRDIYIVKNDLLKQPDGLHRFWFTTEAFDYYPLAYTVYWFGVRLWEIDPLGFHLTNVVVHSLASTFLAWTLVGLGFADRKACLLVGLLFALHPMNVESVAWICQLKTCLAGMLAFAAAGFFVRGWTLTSLGLFALSLSSKPIAVAFPVAILLFAWWRDGRITRSTALKSLPFFAASLLFGAVGVYFQQANAIGEATIRTDSFLTRVLASSWAVWFYAWKGTIPVDLMFVYPRWNVAGSGILGFVPLVALVAVAVWLWAKRPFFGRTPVAVFAAYLLMVLPSSGIVDVYYWRYSYVGDHYAYQSLPILIAAWVGVGWILLRRRESAGGGTQAALAGRLAALVVVSAFAVQSVRLSKNYKDEPTLWEATLRRNPDAWLAHTNLAGRLFQLGQTAKAESHIEAAFKLRPDFAESHANMALYYRRRNRHAEAADLFRKATELAPFEGNLWQDLGVELARLGRNDEALTTLQKAAAVDAARLRIGPKNVKPLLELARQHLRMDQPDEAMKVLDQAKELRPDEPLLPLNIGLVFAHRKEWSKAVEEFRKTLSLLPNHPEATVRLGRALEAMGELDAALAAFMAGSDGSSESLLSAAWMKCASPKKELRDPKRALAAVETLEPVGVLAAMIDDARAVALAANGRFAEAVDANDRALKACRDSDLRDAAFVREAMRRLERRGELYRKNEAYVGPTSEMAPALMRE